MMADVEIGSGIQQALADAAARWPHVKLAPERFAEFVSARSASATELRADLVLACACLAGQADAIAIFDSELLAPVGARIARSGIGVDAAEEVMGRLRASLFVCEPGSRPKLASYTGRGELRGWLEVVATRESYKVLRKVPPRGDDDILASLPDDDDLEMRHIKTQHRDELGRAFADALAGLPRRDRLLLRQRYLDRLTFDEVAALHAAHRITAMRWFARIEKALLLEIRRLLMTRLCLGASEVAHLVDDARSRFELSLHGLLGSKVTAP
jgi:RNA polymerase sigma-70 factor (ECF subfamily)